MLLRDEANRPLDQHYTHFCLGCKSRGWQAIDASLALPGRCNSLRPFPFLKRLIKGTLRPSPASLDSHPTLHHLFFRSQYSRLPPTPKRQVQNQNKRCKTGFRWQWLSPGGQLLGKPGRARAVGTLDPHQSQLPNRPSCLGPVPHTPLPPLGPGEGGGAGKGARRGGWGETLLDQNDSGTSREGKGPGGMLGVES